METLHDALVGGDDEQHQVDPGGTGHHGAHQPLVPRDVDDAEPAARRQVERREAEFDRDAAGLLLRQTVGVDTGERSHQRGLAVIDVTGGAEDQSGGRVRHAVTPSRRHAVRGPFAARAARRQRGPMTSRPT